MRFGAGRPATPANPGCDNLATGLRNIWQQYPVEVDESATPHGLRLASPTERGLFTPRSEMTFSKTGTSHRLGCRGMPCRSSTWIGPASPGQSVVRGIPFKEEIRF